MLARIAVAIVLGNEAHAVEDDEGTSDEENQKDRAYAEYGQECLEAQLECGRYASEKSSARAKSSRASRPLTSV